MLEKYKKIVYNKTFPYPSLIQFDLESVRYNHEQRWQGDSPF